MNILVINSSPRGMKGNTGRLLEEVLKGVSASGAEYRIVCLNELRVEPCVACDTCHNTGGCGITDDYERIKAQLLACDGFILASPNYIFSVTAQMKALFDRSSGLIHTMALEGKYAAVVETSGGGEDEEVLQYMERVVNTFGADSVGGVGSPVAGVREFPDQEHLFERARALGSRLCACIREKRRFPEQESFRVGFGERMSGLVNIMQDFWTYERDFWAARRRSY